MVQLNSKVDIVRFGKIPDGLGGWNETEETVHKDLPCRINWVRGVQKIFFDKSTHFRDAKLYCKVVDIRIKDRVRYNGSCYEVIEVANPDNLNRHLVLDIRLVK